MEQAAPELHRMGKGGGGMLWNCLFAAALIAALAMLGCLCKALVLLPMRAKDAVILLPGRGNGGDLEQNVRACLLLRRWGVLRQQIVILDRGLDPEGLALAKRLTALDEHIRLRSGTPETEED